MVDAFLALLCALMFMKTCLWFFSKPLFRVLEHSQLMLPFLFFLFFSPSHSFSSFPLPSLAGSLINHHVMVL